MLVDCPRDHLFACSGLSENQHCNIARGNTSDIWTWTAETVVKVLHPGIPAHWASIEADITQRVLAAGFPVPATDGVVEVDGRPGIVLERIDGETMWQHMKAAPSEMSGLIEVLVDLQVDLVTASPIEGLPDMNRRLASKIASILRGKNKPIYTPHMDAGDFVVVVNAQQVHLTGRKLDQKMYYHYTGYQSGIRGISARKLLASKPEELLRIAVKGMLPKNTLGGNLLKKLKIPLNLP